MRFRSSTAASCRTSASSPCWRLASSSGTIWGDDDRCLSASSACLRTCGVARNTNGHLNLADEATAAIKRGPSGAHRVVDVKAGSKQHIHHACVITIHACIIYYDAGGKDRLAELRLTLDVQWYYLPASFELHHFLQCSLLMSDSPTLNDLNL